MPANIRAEVKWVLKNATNLEEVRNNALHSLLLNSHDGTVFSWHQLGNKRAEKLANKDLLKEFGWFYDTIIVLREYAEILSDAIGRPNESLPGRPSLPNRGTP
jgi:hypothetical protein